MSYRIETLAIHAGQVPDPTSGAVMTPIYQTSTYAQEAVGQHKGYEYSRTGNPTRTALEANLAALEGAEFGLAFASGMAATDAVLRMLSPGDHVLAGNDVYGGTFRLFDKEFRRYGLTFSYVDTSDVALVRAGLRDETKMVWLETPTNPLLNVTDLRAVAKILQAQSAPPFLVVDNTFATRDSIPAETNRIGSGHRCPFDNQVPGRAFRCCWRGSDHPR
jgi:cystathionine beta-lyase/cystathionine gamma-synthase